MQSPVEVVEHAPAHVVVDLPARGAAALRMRIHGLEYPGMASVRVNAGAWISLTNQTVCVGEPARSYGGIGGGVTTVSLTVALPNGPLPAGETSLEFRFNGTDGVASAFRVLSFNFLDASGSEMLPPDTFTQEDPAAWKPPLPDTADVAAGRELWYGAALVSDGLPKAKPIHAHCSGCHARDGRDLKYFNFSNASIVARARFHGLTELQGRQIASYIRTLAYEAPGRPWNPPYQPGPETFPVSQWAAGAGLGAVSPSDTPLPDWNHWLPRVHPSDAFPGFDASAFAQAYETSTCATAATHAFYEDWLRARTRFFGHGKAPDAVYAAQLWQLVKGWEKAQECGLETARAWPGALAAAAAPARMGDSALTTEYFASAWYELQEQLNPALQDPVYAAAHFLSLMRLSGRPEPARTLALLTRAMRSGARPERSLDPRILVAPEWARVFPDPGTAEKRALTESMLAAWLDHTPRPTYFKRGGPPETYVIPEALRGVAGGRVWEALPQFEAAGVNPALLRRMREYAEAYRSLAALYQY